jgi:hypothetical protein
MFPIKQNFCNNENFCKTEILQIFVKFGDISHFRENFKKHLKSILITITRIKHLPPTVRKEKKRWTDNL